MTTQEPPERRRERYTPGHTANATAFMSARNLDTHGGFVLPLLEPGMEVLDAGCGPGSITLDLAQAVLPGRVIGIDRETAQTQRGARIAEGCQITNVHFQTASVYELPFENTSFDLVFSHALFEHLADPAAALAEFRRVLRPGGMVALCSPDWNAFDITPYPDAVGKAIHAYRHLQAQNGGSTAAGARLAEWLESNGFAFVSEGVRFEEYESPRMIAEYLALQLAAADQSEHAEALYDWARHPDACFRQCWRHAVGMKWNA